MEYLNYRAHLARIERAIQKIFHDHRNGKVTVTIQDGKITMIKTTEYEKTS